MRFARFFQRDARFCHKIGSTLTRARFFKVGPDACSCVEKLVDEVSITAALTTEPVMQPYDTAGKLVNVSISQFFILHSAFCILVLMVSHESYRASINHPLADSSR